jgi:carboxypeptidase M
VQEGEFWRVLMPGIYTVEVFAEGFTPREINFAVVEKNPTVLNITLTHVSPDWVNAINIFCHLLI